MFAAALHQDLICSLKVWDRPTPLFLFIHFPFHSSSVPKASPAPLQPPCSFSSCSSALCCSHPSPGYHSSLGYHCVAFLTYWSNRYWFCWHCSAPIFLSPFNCRKTKEIPAVSNKPPKGCSRQWCCGGTLWCCPVTKPNIGWGWSLAVPDNCRNSANLLQLWNSEVCKKLVNHYCLFQNHETILLPLWELSVGQRFLQYPLDKRSNVNCYGRKTQKTCDGRIRRCN